MESSAPSREDESILGILNRLLRGREELFGEIIEDGKLAPFIRAFAAISVILLALYGVATGFYNGYTQAFFAMVKVPLLFLLTVVVCYPILVVSNMLFGARTGWLNTLALILGALAMASIILGAFTPIVLFFVLSDSSYAFMKILHVAIMGIAAVTGLITMYCALAQVCEKSQIYPKIAIHIFRVWMLVFAVVGLQMVWNLRPFVGNKDQPLEFVRKNREGNFYQAVTLAVRDMFYD